MVYFGDFFSLQCEPTIEIFFLGISNVYWLVYETVRE